LAFLAALLPAAPAHASIVFARGNANPSVWIANDDGSGARKLAAGDEPRISPDGQAVVYTVEGDGSRPHLREIPAAGGASKPLLARERWIFAWSPDSRYIAAQAGPLNGA